MQAVSSPRASDHPTGHEAALAGASLPRETAERVRAILDLARSLGRSTLTEPEASALLAAVGIRTPEAIVVASPEDLRPTALGRLDARRVVVKVVSPYILHKTEVGGVRVVDATLPGVRSAIAAMRDAVSTARPDATIEGFSVASFIEHETGPGAELLVGLRWTEDAGPVVTVGLGGVHAELLAADLRPEVATAILSPTITPRDRIPELLLRTAAVRLAATPQRGRPQLIELAAVVDVVERFLALAELCGPGGLAELEVNPFAVTATGLVALDALATLAPGAARDGQGTPREAAPPPRPVHKIARLLEPRSAAIVGVSSRENPGRIILRNLIRDGFDPSRITVVKPGTDTIDGCRCVADVASLPDKVDLFVVVVSASQAAQVVAEVAERDAAETVIVIPGGLEEKSGTEEIVARLRAALARSRERPDGGILVNGGNCLGIRSLPGRYDTLFIPASKLAPPSGHPAPLAILAQSGAFAISRLDRLTDLDPKYVITVGNQMDLTLGDHLAYLADDPSIGVFAVYTEGFARGDVIPFLRAARRITESRRAVILYRGGRTSAGATASASHTAAIAGDVAVTTALARQAGVVVAGSLNEFDDLVRAFTMLHGREIRGPRLGAVSNAGFECVAIADSLAGLPLAPFDGPTGESLAAILRETGIDGIVDVHDPLDLTPSTGDEAFARVVETVLAADDVDMAIVGDVPFTPAQQTLPRADGHDEDMTSPDSVSARLVALWRATTKAWVAVIDAGPRYDPLARALEAGGIPTFRTADAALHALATVVAARLGSAIRP